MLCERGRDSVSLVVEGRPPTDPQTQHRLAVYTTFGETIPHPHPHPRHRPLSGSRPVLHSLSQHTRNLLGGVLKFVRLQAGRVARAAVGERDENLNG